MIVASIDIGTNTILMVVAEYISSSKKITTILNEFRIPRIGKGLIIGGEISREKITLMLKVLKEFKKIAVEHNCEKIIATATNAFRIASNKDYLVHTIKEKLGISVNVISGEEESYLAYLGATLTTDPEDNVLVIDIGGGSTEIIIGKGENIFYKKSFHTGVVSATEKYLKDNPPLSHEISDLKNNLDFIFNELANNNFIINRAIAIAGTPTTLACIKNNLSEYDEALIEGSVLGLNEVSLMSDHLSGLSSDQIIEKYKSVVLGREDILFAGTLILHHLMNVLKLNEVTVSTKGIRYGAIIRYIHLA